MLKEKQWMEACNYFRSYSNKLLINVNYSTGRAQRQREQEGHTLCIKTNRKNVTAALPRRPFGLSAFSLQAGAAVFHSLAVRLLRA